MFQISRPVLHYPGLVEQSAEFSQALQQTRGNDVLLSGDGVLHFSHLIAAGFARYALVPQGDGSLTYVVQLTTKGAQMTDAWFLGNREEIMQALTGLTRRH